MLSKKTYTDKRKGENTKKPQITNSKKNKKNKKSLGNPLCSLFKRREKEN